MKDLPYSLQKKFVAILLRGLDPLAEPWMITRSAHHVTASCQHRAKREQFLSNAEEKLGAQAVAEALMNVTRKDT